MVLTYGATQGRSCLPLAGEDRENVAQTYTVQAVGGMTAAIPGAVRRCILLSHIFLGLGAVQSSAQELFPSWSAPLSHLVAASQSTIVHALVKHC